MYRVFVDGQEGTTGLQIYERLAGHPGVEVLQIDPERRKESAARQELLNAADVAFLCLPDVAARESVALVTSEKTRVIDASTAHRTNPEWVYGLPELAKEQRGRIREAKRVAVPGCYATGFILALYPLVKGGVVAADYPVTCHAVSGYSGGGKGLISQYQGEETAHLNAPRAYALGLSHKHLPEMQYVCGLAAKPLFAPMVSNYYKGMAVFVPLYRKLLNGTPSAEEVQRYLADYYAGERFVQVMPFEDQSVLENGFLNLLQCNETNRNDVFVFGNEEQVLLVSRLDNLGKGASGAAVQNMNIMLGFDEGAGLG